MGQFIINISNPETEREFLLFTKSHADVEVLDVKSPIQYDPAIYDKNGDFQRINLASPGLPVSDEYIAWKNEKSLTSGTLTRETFLNRLQERKK